MNEDQHKVRIGRKGHLSTGRRNNYVKPSGKFWKRYFNKKVRNGSTPNRGNWWIWC